MPILTISDVVKNTRDLPSLPSIVIELLKNFEQESAGSKLLAENISNDQALTAKTLRLANSSFYGMQSKVGTIQQAITILGFNSVQTLVTAVSITGAFSASATGAFKIQSFWRHAIATALCAKALARHVQVSQDHAFMAGLLHDIGTLVLVVNSVETYEQILAYRAEHDCYISDAERAVLGYDHAMVGRALAEHWKFPLVMQNAIEFHHAPNKYVADSLVGVVHVANVIAHGLDLSCDEDDLVPPLFDTIWTGLALSDEVLRDVFRSTELRFEETCQIFGLT